MGPSQSTFRLVDNLCYFVQLITFFLLSPPRELKSLSSQKYLVKNNDGDLEFPSIGFQKNDECFFLVYHFFFFVFFFYSYSSSALPRSFSQNSRRAIGGGRNVHCLHYFLFARRKFSPLC